MPLTDEQLAANRLFAGAGRGDCSFSSLQQCQATASAGTPIARKIPTFTPKPNCSLIAAANPHGDTDAHSGLGDFGDRDGLNRAGGGPDVRSGISGLPTRVHPGGQLLRMPLHVAASVQRVGIGPRGTVRHQSIFRGLFRARGLSAASSRLLKADSALVSESERQVEQ